MVDHFRADRIFRAAALARTLLCAAAACALAVLPAAGIAATTVVMTAGSWPAPYGRARPWPSPSAACGTNRASYTPSRTAADPAGTGHPAAAQADAPRTA